jgi:hypothetical protein
MLYFQRGSRSRARARLNFPLGGVSKATLTLSIPPLIVHIITERAIHLLINAIYTAPQLDCINLCRRRRHRSCELSKLRRSPLFFIARATFVVFTLALLYI